MNLERMDQILAEKRELHPELNTTLDWKGLMRVLKRESIRICAAPLPNPARLAQFDGSWAIIVGSNFTRQLGHAAHELAHLWLHVDEKHDRFEHCLNYTYAVNTDPREDEAEYFSYALIYGPRIFPQAAIPVRFREEHKRHFAPIELEGNGSFRTQVVGVAHRQRALEGLFGPRTPEGCDETATAVLRSEDGNVHDPMAVRVEISGRHVGYLSRANARVFRKTFGNRTVHAPARITGGWDRGGGLAGYFGVRLDMEIKQ